MEETSEKKSNGYGYGKRPLWQWIVLYVVVGAVVYSLLYYFVLGKKGGYSTSVNQTQQPVSQTNKVPSDNIYMLKTDPAKGNYLTDFQGMTLYTYDQDKPGVSNCTGSCAATWRPYSSGATAQSQFPANITVIKRADGSQQFAWKNMPLYYFSSETKAGQITGDGVNGFHLAK